MLSAARLLPGDVVARVAPAADRVAGFEIELARQLAESGSPAAAPDPRVEPRVYRHDGFLITFWTHYQRAGPPGLSPAGYAQSLGRLHAGLRSTRLRTPHFTDRVAQAQHLVESAHLTPGLAAADRQLLVTTLVSAREAIARRSPAEQVLHGEPHPGNLLSTESGPRFLDFETCCRGPVEFDLAHVPAEVGECYAGGDRDVLSECRGLVLAMVAAWRWDQGDQYPGRQRAGRELLDAVRAGPPWPPLDAVMR